MKPAPKVTRDQPETGAASRKRPLTAVLTPHPRGIPESGRAPWDIPRDDTASPDYGVVLYRDAGQNNGAAANPYIAANGNWPAELRSRRPRRRIAWMVGGV